MSLALYSRVQCNVLLGVMCGNSPSQNRHVKGHRAAVACLRPCVGLCEPEIGRGLHGIWCAAAQIQALSSRCSSRMQSEATLNTKPGRESIAPALASSRCWLDAPVGTAPPQTSGQRVTAAEHVLRSPGPNTGCCRMPPTPTIAPASADVPGAQGPCAREKISTGHAAADTDGGRSSRAAGATGARAAGSIAHHLSRILLSYRFAMRKISTLTWQGL
jgi:hypothetical protein